MSENRSTIEAIIKQGLNTFLDYASIGVILVNKPMDIIMINKFALLMFGYEEDELVGKSLNLLLPARFHTVHNTHHANYFHSPENRPMGTGMDLFAKHKDGTEFFVEVSLGTYYLREEVYVIAFVTDVTLRKENEAAIKKLNADLELKVADRTEALADAVVKLQAQIKETEAARKRLAASLEKEKELGELKSRFVSMASHEFRTPLSTILSSTYLLQKYTETEDQTKREKHLERILSSVQTLNDILDDLLSVGKIEEGKLQVKFQPVDLNELMKDLINQFVPILKDGQHLTSHHAGHPLVITDLSLIRHVIVNLISNAIKFSNEHSEIKVLTSANKDGSWTFLVKDQGIGIPEEDKKNLFSRFFRASNTATIKGTGLGLHIVSKYVELLKGTIDCQSVLNEGTTFKLNFPKREI